LGRNIETQAVLQFVDADEMLPGFPAATAKVEFMWLANEIFTRLERVLVVARDEDRLLWEYEIEAVETVVPFPVATSAEAEDHETEDLVTLKVTGSKKQETDKE
jgi:hypothetical protein